MSGLFLLSEPAAPLDQLHVHQVGHVFRIRRRRHPADPDPLAHHPVEPGPPAPGLSGPGDDHEAVRRLHRQHAAFDGDDIVEGRQQMTFGIEKPVIAQLESQRGGLKHPHRRIKCRATQA